MNISYDWYKIFCWVAELESITLAAEKLYISQPAVSQIVKQLEDALGCILFIRTPKGVKLTLEGQTLFNYVHKGISSITEGEHRLFSLLRLDAGEIKIGASDMTLEFCLLPYLEKFHNSYPKIKIAITNNTTPQTLELLKQGKIDFAAVSEPITYSGFEIYPVREIQDVFICGTQSEINTNVKISDLKDSLILLDNNTSTRKFLDAEFKKRGFIANAKFELATSPQIVGFTSRNLGIGCVPVDFAKQAIDNGTVRIINVIDPLPPRRICIARKQEDHSKAANELIKMILN